MIFTPVGLFKVRKHSNPSLFFIDIQETLNASFNEPDYYFVEKYCVFYIIFFLVLQYFLTPSTTLLSRLGEVSLQDFSSCSASDCLSSLHKCLGVNSFHLSNNQLVFMPVVQHLLCILWIRILVIVYNLCESYCVKEVLGNGRFLLKSDWWCGCDPRG